MALPPPLDPRPLSEPVNHPPGAPREVDIAGCTICLTSGEERIRLEWDQKLGQDSWNPPEHFQGGLKDTEPTAGCPKLPMPSFPEDPAGGKYCETPASGWEVLEAEQDSLHLCLLGLGLRLQHLERGPGPWTSAQSRMVHLQVFEETNSLDQDLEVEGDSDWPGPGGLCSPWAPSSLATLAELEWDPAGDVGGLGPLGQKTAWTPGDSCELCGHRGPQSRGQGLEVRAGMGRFHPGTHRTPLHTSQQGPSLSRRFGGSFSFCLSVCLSVSFSLGVVTVFSSLLPLSLLVSVSSSISLFLSLLSIYIYISSFPLTLPLAHPTTTTLASWLFFRHSKFTPISKAQLASSLHSILTSNVTSSQRPAVASKHHHSLSFYFIS
ncbi:nesprin-4 isoform X3 [Pteropus vampyrus]|uniref:Nesprin-4 isoform X3 n=1 Tax=Pteropus vampyrus TaxID=132908 RepID=A0A6P6BYL9_PTEVA|nr:nesprin-4 isoform X3 [Pteropus vampyrus]